LSLVVVLILFFRRYPQFAKYMGGDSNDASNFKCVYDW
jgi:hypothetical protein